MKTFGIIGGGMIANFHAQAILAMDNAQLGAIYARDENKAVELGRKYHCTGYHELADFLKHPGLEIVTIATPSGAHLEPAVAAADAGKHIICEKPLEINPERIDQMIDACQKNNVMLSGIFNRRFNHAVEVLKHAIDSGRFGKLTLCDAQIKWYRTQEYYESGAWRGTWELDGGGALMNQSIHTIDLLQYLVGPIERLSGTIALLAHKDIAVEDTAAALLQFENGAIGTIQGSTACWSSSGHPAEIQICGSEGSVFLTDDKFRVWDFKTALPEDNIIVEHMMTDGEKGKGANDPSAIDFAGHQKNFEDVVAAIDEGYAPTVSGEEARKAVEIICAIYESAEFEGKWISFGVEHED